MADIRIEGNRVVYETGGELLWLEPYGPDRIRVRASARGRIELHDWTLLPPLPSQPRAYTEDGQGVLVNGRLCAAVTQAGKVTFYRDGEELLAEQSEHTFRHLARHYRHRGGELFQIKVCFRPYDGEHFYGLGQDANDRLDLKGTTSDLLQRNTKTAIPFVYSSRGYGFLWNNPAIGRAELAHNRTLWQADAAMQADYIVAAGDTPAAVMRAYAEMTGFAPAFPHWASGFWQCKLRYWNQDEVLSVAREYKRRGIPLSVLVIDYFHWTEQGDCKFDPKYWPAPQVMADELREMGVKLVVSVWPTINTNSENYAPLNTRNLLVRTENGLPAFFEFHGPQQYVDVTDPAAREYLWDTCRRNYGQYGIDAFWLDQAEPEFMPAHYHNVRTSLGNGEQSLSVYPYYYAQTFADGLRREGREGDICLLVRSAWLGSQRHGALLWSGDVPSTFDSLRRQVKVGLNAAMSGMPWWNSDIGGFQKGNPSDPAFRELLVRWFQFGVFCPVTRLHGDRVWDTQPAINGELLEHTGADNELWSFGTEVYEILKRLVGLRERLRPYVEQHMQHASATGTPVMRPMFYDYPGDEECYTLDDQYLFGPDILFAPITAQGQTRRQVYLPEGVWVDVRDGRVHVGGRFVECTAELGQFIAFVKRGAPVLGCFAENGQDAV